MAAEEKAVPAWLVPGIAAMGPTHDADTAEDLAAQGKSGFRLLHLNESPYPPSPRAVEAAAGALNALNRYPASRGRKLAEALSARTDVAANRIVIGRGSAELIGVATMVTTLPGDDVVMPAPSFPGYNQSVLQHSAKVVRARLDAAGASDPAALTAAITNRTKLLWCCTPNPPTGGMMTVAALEKLVATVPENVLLMLDEAYGEYGRHAGGPESLPIMEKRRGPWAIMRTFSKAYGMSGMRVGYALCGSEEVAESFRKAMGPFHVTTPSLAAAYVLDDQDYLKKTLDAVATERNRLTEGLKALGLSPIPSVANFVSVKMPFPAGQAQEEFEKRGILIRGWRDPEHLSEIRITVGVPEDTDAVLAAMKDILKR